MGTNGARPGRLLRDLLVLFIVASGVVLRGCGGGSSPALVINVSVAPSSSQAIDQGQKIQFTATVTNDTSSKGVTWSQTGQGALSGQTAGAVTYTSPSSGAAGSAAVTATSVADPTKTATVNISPKSSDSFDCCVVLAWEDENQPGFGVTAREKRFDRERQSE